MDKPKSVVLLERYGFKRTERSLQFRESKTIRPFTIDIKTGIRDEDAYTIAIDETGGMWRAEGLVAIDEPEFIKPIDDELFDVLREIVMKIANRNLH